MNNFYIHFFFSAKKVFNKSLAEIDDIFYIINHDILYISGYYYYLQKNFLYFHLNIENNSFLLKKKQKIFSNKNWITLNIGGNSILIIYYL